MVFILLKALIFTAVRMPSVRFPLTERIFSCPEISHHVILLFSFSGLCTCKNSFQTLGIIWENISKTQLFCNYFRNPTKSRRCMKDSLLNEIIHYRKFLLLYSKGQNISSKCFISHLKTVYFHIVISSKLKWLRALGSGTTIYLTDET